MKNLSETLTSSINERRMYYRDLENCLEDFITRAIVCAWDEEGLEFTHDDIKRTLEKLAKSYNVDRHLDWAETLMK